MVNIPIEISAGGQAGENAGFAEASPITEETASTKVPSFATAVKGTSSAAVQIGYEQEEI